MIQKDRELKIACIVEGRKALCPVCKAEVLVFARGQSMAAWVIHHPEGGEFSHSISFIPPYLLEEKTPSGVA